MGFFGPNPVSEPGRDPRGESEPRPVQLIHVEGDGPVVQLDVVPLARPVPGGHEPAEPPFTVTCTTAVDSVLGGVMVARIREWASNGAVVELRFTWKRRPAVVLAAADATIQLDLAAA